MNIDEVYVEEDGYGDKVSGFYSCDLSRYLKVYPNYRFSIIENKRRLFEPSDTRPRWLSLAEFFA
jgi:hypothetical protein